MALAFAVPLSLNALQNGRVTTIKATVAPAAKNEFAYGLPGAIAPAGEFDPLGFSDKADALEMNRLREAELTHGRVGMLASAGFLVQEFWHPLFSADGGPAIE